MRKILFALLSTLTLLSKAEDPSTPYGVCAHLTRRLEFKIHTPELTLMREAGITSVRSDFDWTTIQPSQEQWKFDHLDLVIENAEKANITLLPILCYHSTFAHPAYERLDLWQQYVAKVVTRYHKRLPVWEVWNEQNAATFWENPDPETYMKLLKVTYETIKTIDPSLKVAVGGYAGVPCPFIEKLYQLGGGKYFDIMNVHPYSQPANPEELLEQKLSDLRALMATHGDANKPIWITEVGWSTQQQSATAPGLIRVGLKTAKPSKKDAWRIVVLDEPSFTAPSEELLIQELPENSRVQRLSFDALVPTLKAYEIDAVILPFDEKFIADYFDTLVAYVQQGGILIECGGMPFYYPMTRNSQGVWQESKTPRDKFCQAYRIGSEAWWHNKEKIPEKLSAYYTGPAKELNAPKQGFSGTRFLFPDKLKEQDQFIPLITGVQNGYTGTVAAVYNFNSDLKGAVIVSTLFQQNASRCSLSKQAKVLPRVHLIAQHCGVERLFWYEFQAPETDAFDPESHFGLVHQDLTPKPAYTAYKALTALRPAGSVTLETPSWKTCNESIYQPHWRLPNGQVAGAIWTTQKPGLYQLTFTRGNEDITFTSHLGDQIKPFWNATTSSCLLTITDAPIYFTGGTLQQISAADLSAQTLRATLPETFRIATEQYRGMLKRLASTTNQFPRRWENGQLVTINPKEWTSGFFPGSLWYLHEYTQSPEWREAALHYTAMLEQIRHYTGNHDIGFMLYCSYGNGLRLAHPEGYENVLLDGATALCSRYVPNLKMIRSWDSYNNPVIIDNMMNLELLMWAAKKSGDTRFSEIAINHADQTHLRHFRSDGSAYHIVDYNPRSGKIFGYYAGQGASADSPWARGQSWGLYGFTMMYRETKKPAYLARAKQLADFLINHKNLPSDGIPYWDYGAAEIPYAPRDSSAAAIMANALLELSTFVQPEQAVLYQQTAIRQLLTLSSPAYLAEIGDNGNFLLKHGVGNLPGNSEIDVPLNYGDYYFLEGLLRFKRSGL